MVWKCWTPEFVRVIAAAYSTIQTNPSRKARRAVMDMMDALKVPGVSDDIVDVWGLALKFRGYTASELVVTLSKSNLRVATVSGMGPNETDLPWPGEDGMGPDAEEIAANIEAAWRSRRLRAE